MKDKPAIGHTTRKQQSWDSDAGLLTRSQNHPTEVERERKIWLTV